VNNLLAPLESDGLLQHSMLVGLEVEQFFVDETVGSLVVDVLFLLVQGRLLSAEGQVLEQLHEVDAGHHDVEGESSQALVDAPC